MHFKSGHIKSQFNRIENTGEGAGAISPRYHIGVANESYKGNSFETAIN